MPSSNQVALDRIHPHPDNPRRDAESVDTLAASIKAQGVLQAITIAPHPSGADDTWIVIDGHRRCAAAKALGLDTVPCIIDEGLTDPADQIAAMLATAREREPLSAAEEAAGVQAMLDLGESVATIAGRTGMSKSKVRQRAKVGSLPAELLDKIHTHAVTLADAEFIATHKEYRDELEEKLGTADWPARRQLIVNRVERLERIKAQIAAAKKLGAEAADSFAEGMDAAAERAGVPRSRVGMDRALAWSQAAFESLTDEERELAFVTADQYNPNLSIYVLRLHADLSDEPSTDSTPQDESDRDEVDSTPAEPDPEETARFEAEQLERDQLTAATDVRTSFLRTAPESTRAKFFGRLLALNPPTDGFWIDFSKLPEFQDVDYDDFLEAIAQWFTEVSPVDFAWESAISCAHDIGDMWLRSSPRIAAGRSPAVAHEAVAYVDVLREMGYVLSDIEQAILDAYNATILATIGSDDGDDE
ncbi:ParB/RepB/Spo0J family partition protein [Gordonia sihwensis]|uniref:ParB-like N-terminal domain-containing protein n=1 Tax=Gordonia sihwensis NBRC 108236 TaxID=1223544 RepID=L7LEH1_9ACTN|nr:ParB/RepB/Spo0J family partition protein [Gordonia sihwensis]GAC59309.1 hypothetical protein GSI01S_01_02750 [Gordonia sihwensis NBRC 108236]